MGRGQGAHDDGAACIAAWQAFTILRRAGPHSQPNAPLALWTNEENGLKGARAYRDFLESDVSSHVAAIEMDGGAERPVGLRPWPSLRGQGRLRTPRTSEALATLQPIGALLAGIDASEIRRGGGGADIGPLMEEGVPGLGLRTVGEHYFDWHHTEADTLDKVEPDNLRRAMALLAVMGFVLADMEGTIKKVASN